MNMARRDFVRAAGAFGLGAGFAGLPALAADTSEADALVADAEATVNAFQNDSETPNFLVALSQAKGALVFPRIFRAGLLFGGSGGSGVLLARDQRQNNEWCGPAFYSMGMASVGLQIGVSAAQVIMVVRTQKGLDSLYKSEKGELKLNADASVALLNVGAGAASDTDADFLAFSKVKGAFAGFAVDGAVIAVRSSLNESYYGKPATPLAILLDQSVSNPAATGLQQSLKRLRSMSLSDWVK